MFDKLKNWVAKKKADMNHTVCKIEGFCRVQILEDGKVISDSGMQGPNQIPDLGFQAYLVQLLGAIAGSSQVGYVSLGTGTVPGTAATTLDGELTTGANRVAVTASAISSKTARFLATFASSLSFNTAAATIQNIGLFALTATNNQIMAGNTYATSALATNQDVNITYEIRFSTTA